MLLNFFLQLANCTWMSFNLLIACVISDMVRTAIREGLVPQDPNRRRDKRPTEQQFVNHPEYKKRLAIDRNFILERGITVEELGGTSVPEVVESRGWAGYVCRPRNVNLSLVKEFYANLEDA